MHKIDWICSERTFYHDFFFSNLATESDVDLTVHFVHRKQREHPWKQRPGGNFSSRAYERNFGLDLHVIGKSLRERKSLFIVAGWNDPTALIVMNLLIALGQPFAVLSDTPKPGLKRGRLKQALRGSLLRHILRHSRFIIGTGSPAIRVFKQMGCDESKLVNLPFYTDLNYFRPSACRRSRQEPASVVFLSCGQLLNRHKAYDVALRAFRVAKQSCTGAKFLYRIAGQGPDRDVLEGLTDELGLRDSVEFVGWLEHADLPSFYQSGDVFLHSSHHDPYPNVVLEAQACGLPVIGSDVAGSVVDRVVDGTNGFIHRDGDINSLADRLLFCMKNPECVSRMSGHARRTAEQWPVSRGIDTIKRMLARISYDGQPSLPKVLQF
jgi:glycosyltransferase involved in cell wall biosynthesis